LILGIFNLVPAFPLDGGRLLRALLWAITGNLLKATRWAAGAGRGFAWLLMGLGVAMALGLRVPVFGTGFVSGIWLILIGWFLSNAAQMSYQQVLHRDVLRGVPVTRLMYARVDRVPPELSVQALVEEGILHSDQRAFPVVENERLVGLVCLDDVRRVPREHWADRTVREVMTPADRLATVGPEDDALHALKVLSEREVNQVPVVVEDGRVVGVVRRQDIVKWLTLLRPLEASSSS
jgi:CBS domain-containing protein